MKCIVALNLFRRPFSCCVLMARVLPGMPCDFPLTYFIFCYALPSLLRTKCCANALQAPSLSLTFFYDLKAVSLGPSLLSVLNIDLSVAPSHCCCLQTPQLSKFTHKDSNIPHSWALCLYLLLLFPHLPARKHFHFTSKLGCSVNFSEWFTCFMVKKKNLLQIEMSFFCVTVIIFSIWGWDSTVGFLCHIVICMNLSLNVWKLWHISKKNKVCFLYSSQFFHRYGRWVLPRALVFPSSTTNRRFLKILGLFAFTVLCHFYRNEWW